jgi:acetyl esterase/lipase
MPLDPQARAYLDETATLGFAAPRTVTPDEWRAQAPIRAAHFNIQPQPIAKTEDRTVPSPDGDIPIRIFTPDAPGPLPILVHYHGGGWVIGSVDQSDNLCRAMANLTPCIVVSVEYRLAPETRFPGGPEDCYAATKWVAEHGAELGGDPSRLAIGGESAGGNLAAAIALMARDRGGPEIAFQLLVYPVTDANFETSSWRENAEGYGLTSDTMQYFWELYLSDSAHGSDPLASVLRADVAGLPPALVITAEYDILRDEGIAYAEKLKAAGVPVEHAHYPGQIHGFFNVGTMMETGDKAVAAAARSLAAALAPAAIPAS